MEQVVAQIKHVMDAPQKKVKCILLKQDGNTEQVCIDHRNINHAIGGPPTVVGAVRKLNVQAVGNSDQKGPLSKHKFPTTFEKKLRGHVLLFRTDENAAPQDLNVQEYRSWVDQGMQEPDEDEESQGEESESEESGSKESEAEESDDYESQGEGSSDDEESDNGDGDERGRAKGVALGPRKTISKKSSK